MVWGIHNYDPEVKGRQLRLVRCANLQKMLFKRLIATSYNENKF